MTTTMTNPQGRSIVLINLKPPYELKATTLRMAAPDRTSTVQQVLVASETDLLLIDLINEEDENNSNANLTNQRNNEENDSEGNNKEGNDEPDKDKNEAHAKVPCTTESFTEIFNQCHTVVIPDSMFIEKSRIFNFTEAFVQHGVPALKTFYESGGTVLVQCVEGALSSTCTSHMNNVFGTDWKVHVLADAVSLGPTEACRRLLETPYLPQEVELKNSAFFVSCPSGEGLYQIILPTKEEFTKSFHEQDDIFERLGIEKDESMNTFHCFDVEKSWEDYQNKYTDRYGLALHAHNGGGHVIWYGDRSQTNRTMSFLFCKLLNIGTLGYQDDNQLDNDDDFAKVTRLVPSGTILVAFLVVLLAILAKLWGF